MLEKGTPVRLLRALNDALRAHSRAASMARVVVLRSLALGVSVCTGVLTAAVLGPAGRGEQSAITVAPYFLAGLATLGLHASLIYNMKADSQNEREYVGANLIMTGISGVLIAVVGWVAAPHWLTQYSAHDIALARAFLCTTPFTVMTWGLLGAAEAHGRFGFANRVLYVQSLCILAMLLVLAWLHLLTPGTAGAAYMVPTVPVFLYFAWRTTQWVRPVLTLRAPFPGRLLRYGLRFYGVDLLGTLSGYLDQIIIITMLAPGLVGLYAVAQSLSRIPAVVQGAVSSVLFPSVAARGTAVIVETVATTIRVTSIVIGAMALALSLAGPHLLSLLYGAAFAKATGPMRILLLDAVVSSSARILYQAYSGSGRPGWVTGFEAAGVAVAAVGMLTLVPHLGLTGAALAVLLASSVRLALGVAGLPLVLKSEMPRLLLSRSDVRAWLRSPRIPTAVEDAAP